MALNNKQERFCREYVKTLNSADSYKKVYKSKSDAVATAAGSRLLSNVNVAAQIKKLQEQRAKRTNITADRLVKELGNIAFGNIKNISEWSDSGLKIKDSKDLTMDEAACIASITSKPIIVKDNEGKVSVIYETKIRLKNSDKQFDILSRHLGVGDGTGGSKDRDRESLGRELLERPRRIREKRRARISKRATAAKFRT